MLQLFRTGDWITSTRARTYAAMIAVIGVAGLVYNWTTGGQLTDNLGRPIGTDFAGMWTAGRMLLEGNPYGLFDPEQHFAYQRAFFGDPGIDVYGWHYPPFFLAIAAVLASPPYLPALVVWQASSFVFYLSAMRAIAPPHKALLFVAAGFPAVFVTLGHGHNAFLTAGLLGFGLFFLDRRPLLAGVLIGLLAYKPQFGLVLPVVLVLGGHWRALAAAASTVLVMSAAVTLWLGPGVWSAFLDGASFTKTVILEQGVTGWHKIQSMFSALRSLGAPVHAAYAGQAIVTLAVIAALALVVWRRADARLVAALAASGALLATPYCLDYDMTILGVAIAFAAAHGAEKGFAPWEKTLLALVWVTPLFARVVMQWTHIPLGVLATGALFAFLSIRCLRAPADVRAAALAA